MRRLTAILTLLLCLPFMASAQGDFTQLDWQALRIDSVLPVYTEVVPLETDYRHYDYRVRVTYPQWAPLTAREVAVVRPFDTQLTDSLCIETFVGVSRGQGLLDISFVPIVRQDGRYMKLLSGKIEIQALAKTLKASGSKKIRMSEESSTTTPPSSSVRYAEHSKLASGRWVKMCVTDDGIYHLTNKQLRAMGFATPSRIRVYGYGGHLQNERIDADTDWDDLEEVALMPVDDGYLFYANGLVHWQNDRHVVNHYARQACYFVTEADTDVEPLATIVASVDSMGNATPTPTTFKAHFVYDPQEYAWYQGGRQLYENYDYATGNSRSYTIDLPTAIAPNSSGTLNIRFTAAAAASTTVTPTFNGKTTSTFTILPLASYEYAAEATKSLTIASDDLSEHNTLRLATTAGNSARLNYIELTYSGTLRLSNDVRQCRFDTNAETIVLEYAAGQQPQLWRLAQPGEPAVALGGSVQERGGSHYLSVPLTDATERCYVAFDAAAYASYPQPVIVGQVANQDLHAVDSLDMVILTPASGLMDAQAQRLADVHRTTDGLRVGVFRADQIYNEFSSGTPDATAYRRFLKMLYDRAADGRGNAPRYLLLFGDAAWDNRMLTAAWRTYSPDDFLLCYESENSAHDVKSYVMEDYFGLLDDGEGVALLREKVDLGVGRFPVRTAAEAATLVDKTIRYIHSDYAGAWKNVIAFLGDDGDNNSHLDYADKVAERVSAQYPEVEVRKIMWDAYPRESTASGLRFPLAKQAIVKQMDEGALMMNYTGHAAPYSLSHEQVLRIEDFAAFNSPRVPLWVTAACDVMPFDTQKENIGETAMLNAESAAIAFFGTARTVYANLNYLLNCAFCDAVFDTDEDGRPNRLGDAVRLSKVTLVSRQSDTSQNKLHYALLGDPALRLGSIQNRVLLDSINGTAVTDLPSDFTIHAGSRIRLAGHVNDTEGQTLEDFNGTLHARLYDSKSTVVCLNADHADNAFTYTTYDKILYNGIDSIRCGRFDITCPVPIDIKYSDANGRLLFYAISDDHLTEANGYNEDFCIGGTEPELNDTIGPAITAWLGTVDFTNGDVVCATPYFVARLQDESGINTAGNSLGHDLELIIDGDPVTTYNLNDYFTGDFGDFTKGTVAFSIPELTDGPHSLLFRAWDTQNNEGHVRLDFTVNRSLGMHLLDLTASVNPASTTTSFLLTYDRPGSECHFTIEVFDFAGRLLWTHSETGANATGLYSIPWGLVSGSGFPLGSGIYLYRARVSCGDSEESTKTQKLVIRRSF